MADDNKVYIPASSGGVVTYYKDSESKIKIDPNYIVIAIVVILILEFILHQSQIFLKWFQTLIPKKWKKWWKR